MERIKLAIVGAGPMAEKHLDVFSGFEDVEIIAICNKSSPRAGEIARKYGIQHVFQNCREMIEKRRPDAALVSVALAATVEVAGSLMDSALPLLIEKPIGLNVLEAEKLVQFFESKNAWGMVAMNRRFYWVVQNAHRLILEKGPLVGIAMDVPEKFNFAKKNHPEEIQERWLFANGIHCIDLLRFFGGEIKKVTAYPSQWFESQKDSFHALLEFESGAHASYVSNWTSPGPWSISLYGNKRRVVLSPLEQGYYQDEDGGQVPIQPDFFDQKFKPGLYAQNRYFIDCVKSGKKPGFPASNLNDAVKSMYLADKIFSGTS